jgi:hypothetical protein
MKAEESFLSYSHWLGCELWSVSYEIYEYVLVERAVARLACCRGRSVIPFARSWWPELQFTCKWNCKILYSRSHSHDAQIAAWLLRTSHQWLRKLLHLSETRFCGMCLAIILVYKFTDCSRLVLEVPTWNIIGEKVKCTLVQALRLCTGRTAQMGSRGIALLFHDHGTRRGWGVSVTPRPLFTPGKDPVPIVQEAGWAPRPVWTGAENFAPIGIRSPDRPPRSQSLYQLRYPAHESHWDYRVSWLHRP